MKDKLDFRDIIRQRIGFMPARLRTAGFLMPLAILLLFFAVAGFVRYPDTKSFTGLIAPGKDAHLLNLHIPKDKQAFKLEAGSHVRVGVGELVHEGVIQQSGGPGEATLVLMEHRVDVPADPGFSPAIVSVRTNPRSVFKRLIGVF